VGYSISKYYPDYNKPGYMRGHIAEMLSNAAYFRKVGKLEAAFRCIKTVKEWRKE